MPEKVEAYPNNCFAVQVVGNALYPKYKSGDWCVFNSEFDIKACVGKIVLIHHKDIQDEYSGNLTIRRLNIQQVPTDGLFNANIFCLEALNEKYEPIILKEVPEGRENIIGVVYGAKEPMYEKGKDEKIHIFAEDEISNSEKYTTALPIYSLKAAATKFGKAEYVEKLGWVRVQARKKLHKDMFVVQVVGKSMEPIIPDSSYCIFQFEKGGSRNGKVVLVESRQIPDPETGQNYTVKRYMSEKQYFEDGTWMHKKITLSPANQGFEDIVLENVAGDDFRVVAEFIEVV